MDALFRVVRKSPQAKSKKSKIPESWGENDEPVEQGVSFCLKYIGSVLVEEIAADETYGDGISAKAVSTIIAMAKSAGRKLQKTSLTVSPRGMSTRDAEAGTLMFDISIYRISFCTADKTHDKVFAYIARNTTNETMECHAFLCPKTKIAQAVTLTVSQAFSIAQDKYIEKKKLKKSLREKSKNQSKAPLPAPAPTPTPCVKTATLISLTDDPEPPKPILNGTPTKQQPTQEKVTPKWESFDDDDSNDIDDMFSQLASNRSRPLPSLASCTDLNAEDVDEGVQEFMGGSAFDAFAKTQSHEDLFNL